MDILECLDFYQAQGSGLLFHVSEYYDIWKQKVIKRKCNGVLTNFLTISVRCYKKILANQKPSCFLHSGTIQTLFAFKIRAFGFVKGKTERYPLFHLTRSSFLFSDYFFLFLAVMRLETLFESNSSKSDVYQQNFEF